MLAGGAAGDQPARFVRFSKVTLQGFRNLPLVDVALAGRRTFLLGANAQGKTNFLEALGYAPSSASASRRRGWVSRWNTRPSARAG
jgi:recombinational DNA repair ATPase RecF